MATVLITEADSGIGSALAVGLAAHNHDVIAASKSAAFPEGFVPGMTLVPIQLDLAHPDSISDGISYAAETYPSIDVVIANGTTGTFSPLELLADEEFERTLTLNLVGQLRLFQAVIPHLRRAGRGRLIGISGTVGMLGLPGGVVPCAARAGFEVAMEALRHELQPFGVSVAILQAAPTSQADYGLPSPDEDALDGAYGRLIRTVNSFGCQTLPSDEILQGVLEVMVAPEPEFRQTLGLYRELLTEVRQAGDNVAARIITDFLDLGDRRPAG